MYLFYISHKFLVAYEPGNAEELFVDQNTCDLVIRAHLALLQYLLVVVKVLQSFPEVQVEPLLSLIFLPVFCEFINVTTTISEEELSDVVVIVLVSLVIIRSEVYGFGELSAVVGTDFAYMNEFLSVLINQQLYLDIKLFHSIFILLARVANKFFQAIRVQVEVQVRAEEFSLVQDLISNH